MNQSLRHFCLGVFLFGFVAVTSGCVTSSATYGNFHEPEVGVTTTSEIGESMFWTVKGYATSAVKVQSDIEFQVDGLAFKIPRGIYRNISGESYDVSEKIFVMPKPICAPAQIVEYSGAFILKYELFGLSGNGHPNQCNASIFGRPEPDKKGEFLVTDKVRKSFSPELVNQEDFQKELVYTGVSGKVVSLLYREYVAVSFGVYSGYQAVSLARPAFTQELKYDLSESTIIGFKGARFEVLSADNLGITFKLLRQFD